jgi:hypothetical protein
MLEIVDARSGAALAFEIVDASYGLALMSEIVNHRRANRDPLSTNG